MTVSPDEFRIQTARQHLEEAQDLMMYRVGLRADGSLLLIDDNGNEPDEETAYQLAQAMNRRYAPRWYVYIGKRRRGDAYKIGISQNPAMRAHKLGIDLLHVIECGSRKHARDVERFLHAQFTDESRDLRREWFTLEDEDMDEIKAFEVSLDVFHVGWEAYAALFGFEEDEIKALKKENLREFRRLLREKLEGMNPHEKTLLNKPAL